MTQKDYVVISQAIKNVLLAYPSNERVAAKIAFAIANAMKRDNPNFRYGLFMKACGIRIDADAPPVSPAMGAFSVIKES